MEAAMTQLVEPSRKSALPKLDDAGRAALFTQARTANSFADTPVTDSELADIWELAKWAPTSANLQPLRVLFVRGEARQRLVTHMSEGNKAKTATAPAISSTASIHTRSAGTPTAAIPFIRVGRRTSLMPPDISRAPASNVETTTVATNTSRPPDDVGVSEAWEPVEPRVLAGVADVHHQDRAPAPVGEEIGVKRGCVEAGHWAGGEPVCTNGQQEVAGL